MNATYTPGTVVQFIRYGTRYTGTVIQAPRGNVLLVRVEGRGSLTWAPVEAVQIYRPIRSAAAAAAGIV